jgi:hypothetical protein
MTNIGAVAGTIPVIDGEVPNECSPCLYGRGGVHRRAHWQDGSL